MRSRGFSLKPNIARENPRLTKVADHDDEEQGEACQPIDLTRLARRYSVT